MHTHLLQDLSLFPDLMHRLELRPGMRRSRSHTLDDLALLGLDQSSTTVGFRLLLRPLLEHVRLLFERRRFGVQRLGVRHLGVSVSLVTESTDTAGQITFRLTNLGQGDTLLVLPFLESATLVGHGQTSTAFGPDDLLVVCTGTVALDELLLLAVPSQLTGLLCSVHDTFVADKVHDNVSCLLNERLTVLERVSERKSYQ